MIPRPPSIPKIPQPKRKLTFSERFWLWWHDICPKHFERRSHWENGKPDGPYLLHYHHDIVCPVCRRARRAKQAAKASVEQAKEREILERAAAMQARLQALWRGDIEGSL